MIMHMYINIYVHIYGCVHKYMCIYIYTCLSASATLSRCLCIVWQNFSKVNLLLNLRYNMPIELTVEKFWLCSCFPAISASSLQCVEMSVCCRLCCSVLQCIAVCIAVCCITISRWLGIYWQDSRKVTFLTHIYILVYIYIFTDFSRILPEDAKSPRNCEIVPGALGWLRLVGSIKLHVSFAGYSLFYMALLQKRPIILPMLLTEATSHSHSTWSFQ